VHNRLTSVNDQPIYRYNPDGLCVQEGTTAIVIDPNAGLSRILRRGDTYYIWGANGLEYEINGSVTKTYHTDHLGSTMLLTDASGAPTGEYFEYDSYGNPTYTAGNPTTPFRWHGTLGVMTSTNGLVNMRARFYNPRIMRFMSADPLGFGGGMNWFAFAGNNPISFLDPRGLCREAASQLIVTGDSNTIYWGSLGPMFEEMGQRTLNGLIGAGPGAMTGATSGALIGAGVGGALGVGVGAGPGAVGGAGAGAIAGGASGFIDGFTAPIGTPALSIVNQAGLNGYVAGAFGGLGAAANSTRFASTAYAAQSTTARMAVARNAPTGMGWNQFQSYMSSQGLGARSAIMSEAYAGYKYAANPIYMRAAVSPAGQWTTNFATGAVSGYAITVPSLTKMPGYGLGYSVGTFAAAYEYLLDDK
jgi:RHS repeat-associated protein